MYIMKYLLPDKCRRRRRQEGRGMGGLELWGEETSQQDTGGKAETQKTEATQEE